MKLVATVLVLAGCSKSEPKHPPQDVRVSLGGAPELAIDRAFIKRISPDVFSVLVGAGKGSCASLLGGTNEGTGQALGLTIEKRVTPVGHETYVLTSAYSRDFDATGIPAVPVGFTGSADKGGTAAIELPELKGKHVAIAGSITAVGCGDAPRGAAGVPTADHPSKGTIIVAGKAVKIVNMTVRVRPGAAPTDAPNIVISTGPRDCSGIELPAPVILERTDGNWTLRGTWFDKPIEGAGDLAFSANNTGKSVDGPTLMLQLSGKGKFGDYSVELMGRAQAIECTR